MNNFTNVLELYSSHKAMYLVDELSRVISHYMQARQHYTTLHTGGCEQEYQEHLTVLKELREVATHMATLPTRCLMAQNDDLKVNLDPWVKYLEEKEVDYIAMILRSIDDRMAQYLKPEAIAEYQQCRGVVQRFLLYFINEYKLVA